MHEASPHHPLPSPIFNLRRPLPQLPTTEDLLSPTQASVAGPPGSSSSPANRVDKLLPPRRSSCAHHFSSYSPPAPPPVFPPRLWPPHMVTRPLPSSSSREATTNRIASPSETHFWDPRPLNAALSPPVKRVRDTPETTPLPLFLCKMCISLWLSVSIWFYDSGPYQRDW